MQDIAYSRFLRKYFRLFIVEYIANLIPIIAIPYISMKLLDQTWRFFWVMLTLVCGILFVIWLLKSVLDLIIYYAFRKGFAINSAYEYLVEQKFPNPEDHWPEYSSGKPRLASYYYENILNDDSQPCEVRLNAGIFVLEYQRHMREGHYLTIWRMQKIHEAALTKYKQLHFARETNI